MYNLNINKSSVVPTNLIVGRVLDKPFDVFQFKIFNGLDPLDLTSSTIEFRGVTPDNKKVISTDIKIIDAKSGEIEFKIPSNFYSASGKFRNAYFRITKSGQTESTNDLLINVLNAVDLNLDDSQIIIDQLDKIIEDAIAKLDKELANVKLQISQVDGNIKALKKDVEDYKATFKVQMDAMQKQLDELAKAINQTDIQRPKITAPNGKQLYYFESSTLTFHELVISKITSPGYYKLQSFSSKGQPLQYLNGMIDVSVADSENDNYSYQYISWSSNTGQVYSYTHHYGKDYGWKRLDGQVAKITADDGSQLYNPSKLYDNMQSFIISEIYNTGIYKIAIGDNIKDAPVPYLNGILNVIDIPSKSFTFLASSHVDGTAYAFSSGAGLGVGVWRRLDNILPPIVSQSQDGLMTTADKVKLDGLQNYSLVTTSTNGLMSASDKVKLNGLKSYSNATPSASGLMSATDKKKLDGITFTKVGTV